MSDAATGYLWEYDDKGVYPEIRLKREDNGAFVTLVCDWDARRGCLQPPGREHGERMVACVNACRGIDPATIPTLLAQRDKLKEACKAAQLFFEAYVAVVSTVGQAVELNEAGLDESFDTAVTAVNAALAQTE